MSILNYSILNALIIDDELDICYLLGSILKQNNITCSFVNTIIDAPRALLNNIPNMVFLDNHLPDGMGIDFIQYIKVNYPNSKIVMISAHDSTVEKQTAFGRGADIFLGKPFNKAAITTLVNTLFN